MVLLLTLWKISFSANGTAPPYPWHISDNAAILASLDPLLKAISFPSKDRGQRSDDCKYLCAHLLPLLSNQWLANHPPVANSVARLITAIQAHQETPGRRVMEARAMANLTTTEDNPWAAARHASGRLVSYRHAVATLTIAHHLWGARTVDSALFLEYDVSFLHSSKTHPDPLSINIDGNPAKPQRIEAMTADDIIGRMPGGDAQVPLRRQQAAVLQARGGGSGGALDGAIAKQWQSKIEPRVHCEMLVLQYLRSTPGGTQSHRFFGGWRYIGSSKPTCRLCKYYFDMTAPEVATRDTHNNVYYDWRLPDTYRLKKDPKPDSDSGALTPAQKHWRDTSNQIKEWVCRDAVRLLEGQVRDNKPHDSNTYTDQIRESESVMAMTGAFRDLDV